MAINPNTPFLFNPFPAQMPILPARRPAQRSDATVMPARATATNGEGDEQAVDGDGGLPSWLQGGVLPAVLLGLGAGRSIQQGSIDPLLGAGTGLLAGISERQQREAEAAAEAEQLAFERKEARRKERQELQPEIQFSRGGFTGSFTPEAVPESVFGQPLTPESREREERERFDKGIAELELAFNALPIEPDKSKRRVHVDALGQAWWLDDVAGKAERIPGPAAKPAEAMKLPDGSLANPIKDDTGRTIGFAPIEGGEPADTQSTKPPTEIQARARMVYPRAAEALETLEKLMTKYGGAPTESLLGRALPGRLLQPDEVQQWNAAAEQAATAVLRMESGAAITKDEAESYKRQFIPLVGGKPDANQLRLDQLRRTIEQIRDIAGLETDVTPDAAPGAAGDGDAEILRLLEQHGGNVDAVLRELERPR